MGEQYGDTGAGGDAGVGGGSGGSEQSPPGRRAENSMRLIELRLDDDPGAAIAFHPHLTLLTGCGAARSGLAHWIASSLAGPRPAGARGDVEVAGRRLRLDDLPPLLLPPDTTLVLTVGEVIAARSTHLGAVRAAVRSFEGEQEARVAQARATLARAEADLAASDDALADLDGKALALRADRSDVDRASRRVARADDLLGRWAVARAVPPAPDPEAVALAREWEVLTATRMRVEARPKFANVPDAEVALARARAELSRLRPAAGPTPEGIARMQELRREVAAAEAEVEAARRSRRNAALLRLDAALQAEREALAELGYTSRSDFLVDMAQGSRGRADAVLLRAADARVATCEADLAAAREAVADPTLDELDDAALALKARAVELLGRIPSDDVFAELLALHHDSAALVAANDALRVFLAEIGVTGAAAEPVVAARSWLATARQGASSAETAIEERTRSLQSRRAETLGERAAAERACEGGRERVAEAEGGLAAARSTAHSGGDTEVGRPGALGPIDVEVALGALIEERRTGRLLPGRFPLIVDDVVGDLDGPSCERALSLLQAASADLQVILLTDRPLAATWAGALGVSAAVVAAPASMTAAAAGVAEVAEAGPGASTAPAGAAGPYAPAPPAVVDEPEPPPGRGQQRAASDPDEVAWRAFERSTEPEAERRDRWAAGAAARPPRRSAAKARREEAGADKARRAAEEKARREADEQTRREAEAADKARREAEAADKVRREAEEKARRDAEAADKVRREAEAAEKAEREAREKARRQAEREAAREEKQQRREVAERIAAERCAAKEDARAAARFAEQQAKAAKTRARAELREARAAARGERHAGRDAKRLDPEARARYLAESATANPAPATDDLTAAAAVEEIHLEARPGELPELVEGRERAERIARIVALRAGVDHAEGPLAVCTHHRNLQTRLRCERCGRPFCDQCVVSLGDKRGVQCVECALIASGARSRRKKA